MGPGLLCLRTESPPPGTRDGGGLHGAVRRAEVTVPRDEASRVGLRHCGREGKRCVSAGEQRLPATLESGGVHSLINPHSLP